MNKEIIVEERVFKNKKNKYSKLRLTEVITKEEKVYTLYLFKEDNGIWLKEKEERVKNEMKGKALLSYEYKSLIE